MVRINIILPESKRERFFDHCRHLKKPRRLSMNLALNAMIDAVLSGKVSLGELVEAPPEKPLKPRA